MDLQTLQKQLKSAIQKHQIVVSKMRDDPQSMVLKKHLHDLQSEIENLSEKQKLVVEQLRKELEKKQQNQHQILKPAHCNDEVVSQHIGLVQSLSQPQMQVRLVSSTTPSPFMQKVTIPIKVHGKKPTSKSSSFLHLLPQQAEKRVMSTLVNNLVAPGTNLTLKTQLGTAVILPNNSSTTSDHSVEQQKSQPILVVPSVSSKSEESPRIVLDISSPIRIPQYPPPVNKVIVPVAVSHQTISLSNNSIIQGQSKPVTTSASQPLTTLKPASSVSHLKIVYPRQKTPPKEQQKKSNFMAALGLMTKDALSELQNKKLERKRRTTANPQFSNAALEEKRKNAKFLNMEGKCPPHKRTRGRPRLVSITHKNYVPCTKESLPNGYHFPIKSGVTDSCEEMCAICEKPQELISCDSCNLAYHLNCVQPSQSSVAANGWSCPKCKPSQPNQQSDTHISFEEKSLPVCRCLIPSSITWPTLSNYTVATSAVTMVPVSAITSCAITVPVFLPVSSSTNSDLLKVPSNLTKVPESPSITRVKTTISMPTKIDNHGNPVVTVASPAGNAAKESVKQKLLKRSLTLRKENTQLEKKVQKLTSVIANKTKQQVQLQTLYQKTADCIDKLEKFICEVKDQL
ncbi:PHD finger protein 21A-like [Tachypleus tridentatus]|uniref:PHD finger protein 21A-like n=1 Tax=Tachypleus tridentatus TaxID=6853 RepID=UPI003FD045B7